MVGTYYTIKPTSRFKKDLKKIKKQGLDETELLDVIAKLADCIPLEPANHDHDLGGEYKGCRECHIRPDWLLIYEIDGKELYLYLTRTGSHSELFSS